MGEYVTVQVSELTWQIYKHTANRSDGAWICNMWPTETGDKNTVRIFTSEDAALKMSKKLNREAK